MVSFKLATAVLAILCLGFPTASNASIDCNIAEHVNKAECFCRFPMNRDKEICKPGSNLKEPAQTNYQSKIFNGDEVAADAYPWFSRAVYRTGGSYQWAGCGASLISPEYVLTAAHCVSDNETVLERLGGYQIGALCAPYGPNAASNCGQKMEYFGIAKITKHPSYITDNVDNDFALIRLDGRSSITPVAIDRGDISPSYEKSATKKNLWPIGLGTTEIGNQASRLNHVNINYVKNDQCNSISSYGGLITPNMMCAADIDQDSCQGDSGGPLYDSDNDALVGVVSWGFGCAEPGFPGVYARISSQFSWIREEACKAHGNPKPSFCTDDMPPMASPPPPRPTPPVSDPRPTPPILPQPPSSCVAGETAVMSVDVDDINVDNNNAITRITKVKNLKIGDMIRGYDADLNPTQCRVEAVGNFGSGEVFGNYTSSHYMLNEKSKVIEEHGTRGDMTIDEKYDLISNCPLVEDEVGNKFGPIDSDFCGGHVKEISWSDYLLLHKAILNVVRESGAFWFSGASYSNFDMVNTHAPHVCRTMVSCMKDNESCHELESASIAFIENGLSDSARKRALAAFHNIGSHRRLGSVSASVTSGGSVRKLRGNDKRESAE